MSTRLGIAALVFMMVQAVMFGAGAVIVLATPLQAHAMALMPAMIAVTIALSVPISWWLAPRLRARFWHDRTHKGAGDRMLAALS